MEVLRLGVELGPAISTATLDLSPVCDLLHSSHWILTTEQGQGSKPASSWMLVRFVTGKSQWELLKILKKQNKTKKHFSQIYPEKKERKCQEKVSIATNTTNTKRIVRNTMNSFMTTEQTTS